MTDRLALPRRYRNQLETLLDKHVPGVEVWAYGSRVNGESHEGSDLDLALRSPTLELLGDCYFDLLEAIEKSNIPILVQAHDWAMLPESFHREIERNYVVVQERAKQTTVDEWRRVPFQEVVYFQEGPGIRHWQYRDEGVPFVNIRCLVDGRLDVSSMNRLDPVEVNEKYQHFLLDAGDYVVSSSGTIGRIAEVSEDDLPCMLNTSVIRMRSKEEENLLNHRYLRYFLTSSLFQEQIHALAAGSVQVNYGPTHLNQMWMALPPMPEQRAIAPHPWHTGRQDRTEPADERDAGGDGDGALQVLVRGLRAGPRQDGGPLAAGASRSPASPLSTTICSQSGWWTRSLGRSRRGGG